MCDWKPHHTGETLWECKFQFKTKSSLTSKNNLTIPNRSPHIQPINAVCIPTFWNNILPFIFLQCLWSINICILLQYTCSLFPSKLSSSHNPVSHVFGVKLWAMLIQERIHLSILKICDNCKIHCIQDL